MFSTSNEATGRLPAHTYLDHAARRSDICLGHFTKDACTPGVARKHAALAVQDQRRAGYVGVRQSVPATGGQRLNFLTAERLEVIAHDPLDIIDGARG